jgi:Peptidase family S41
MPFLLVAAAVFQAPAAPPPCAATLDSLRAKIETDYAGYRLEITGARREAYVKELATLGEAARVVRSDVECLGVLRRFTDWFDDPHLGVLERDRHDSTETRRRMAALDRHAVTESGVLADLAIRGRRADPIDPVEGIWYDAGMRMAVVPDPASQETFLVVVVKSDTVTLPVGAVRGRLHREGDGQYAADLLGRDLSRTHVPANLSRRTILRLFPGMWGKAAPLAAADSGLLDPTDVRRPTLVVRDGVPVITVPSNDYGYKHVLDSLVAVHRRVLRESSVLVIDVRGNEGGSSYTTAALYPYIVGADLTPPRHLYRESVMLSSPDQIAYARRAFGAETSPFVRTLVASLQAAPGRLVPLYPDPRTAPDEPKIDPEPGPVHVGLLIDRRTVSAAEVMADYASRTSRTTVMGEPTAGALDYQSTSIVRIAGDEPRWLLIYPTIAAHAGLPADGIRGRGIAPEVPIGWRHVADPIAEVIRRLQAMPD